MLALPSGSGNHYREEPIDVDFEIVEDQPEIEEDDFTRWFIPAGTFILLFGALWVLLDLLTGKRPAKTKVIHTLPDSSQVVAPNAASSFWHTSLWIGLVIIMIILIVVMCRRWLRSGKKFPWVGFLGTAALAIVLVLYVIPFFQDKMGEPERERQARRLAQAQADTNLARLAANGVTLPAPDSGKTSSYKDVDVGVEFDTAYVKPLGEYHLRVCPPASAFVLAETPYQTLRFTPGSHVRSNHPIDWVRLKSLSGPVEARIFVYKGSRAPQCPNPVSQ